MNSTLKNLLFWMVLVVIGVVIWNFSTQFGPRDNTIMFSQFMNMVDTGQVQKVTITGNEIRGTTKAAVGGNDTFRTYSPSYDNLVPRLFEKGVEIEVKPESPSTWTNLLYSWAPILLMIGFWIFLMRQMQSGGNKALSFGKSKARLS